MRHHIVLTPFAHKEEQKAYNWYEEQRVGLGNELLNELENAYYKISSNPHHYGFIDDKKQLRDFLVHRFPYLIVYRINGNTVEVIAVHHAKKHPSKKYKE